jgi:hypothetical protein
LSVPLVFCPCTGPVVLPKYVSAGVQGPVDASLASIRALTVMLLTVELIRQSECTSPLVDTQPPAGHDVVSPVVVVSSTTAPEPPNVSVSRVKTVFAPPPGGFVDWLIVVVPV